MTLRTPGALPSPRGVAVVDVQRSARRDVEWAGDLPVHGGGPGRRAARHGQFHREANGPVRREPPHGAVELEDVLADRADALLVAGAGLERHGGPGRVGEVDDVVQGGAGDGAARQFKCGAGAADRRARIPLRWLTDGAPAVV